MAENLKKFIDLYDAKAAEVVEQAKAQLEKFKTAREKALALSTPVNAEYATLGKLVDAMVSEDGVVNSAIFQDFIQYSTASNEEKELIRSLKKLRNGPGFYKIAEAQQKRGALPFFNSAMQVFGKASLGGVLSFNKLVGADSNEPEDKKISYFLESADELIADAQLNFPPGIIGPEFYYAVVENGNPIGKKEAAGPINEKLGEVSGTPSAAINEPNQETKPGEEKSILNPEKKAAPTAIESSAVTTVPAEMPKEPEQPTGTAAPGIIVNVESAAPTLPKKEEVASAAPATASSTTINYIEQIVSRATEQAKNKEKQNAAINQPKTEISQGGTTNISTQQKTETVNQGSSLSQYLGQDLAGKLDSASGKKETVSTINDKKTNESSKSSESSVKKESTISETKMASLDAKTKLAEEFKRFTGINLEKTTAEKETERQAIIESEKKATAINEEISKKANDSLKPNQEKSETSTSSPETTSVMSALPNDSSTTEVTKTLPTLPEKEKSSSLEKVETILPSVSTNKEAISVQEVKSDSPAEQMGASQNVPTQSAQAMGVDMSGVEQRLARLELLLSGTLDVRIIN